MLEKYITSDKIFSHLKTLRDWAMARIVRPVTLEIHPSNKCNNFCYYCCAMDVKDGHLMTLHELISAIKKIYSMGVKGLIFSGGGEPLCNPHTISAVKFAKSLRLSVGFITNGLMITDKSAKILLHNCEWIRISLDSLNPETYKKIRGVDGAMETIRTMMILSKTKVDMTHKCTLGVQVVVNKYNYEEIYDFAKSVEIKFRNVDYIQIRPLEVLPNNVPYSRQELAHIKNQLDYIKRDGMLKKTIISTKWDLIFGKREYGFSACHCYGMIGVVDAYGDIYICCHTVKQSAFRYGNILTDSIPSIFKKREITAKKMIKDKLHKLCPIGCRGSAINRRLEGLLIKKEHRNFL